MADDGVRLPMGGGGEYPLVNFFRSSSRGLTLSRLLKSTNFPGNSLMSGLRNWFRWSAVCLVLTTSIVAEDDAGGWQHRELRRFPAKEANQGVAVDSRHFYAIDNRTIGKYLKSTGEKVGAWVDEPEGTIRHLNSGIVVGDKLIVAHSNFPKIPAESSVEIWDTATMTPIERRVLDDAPGSLTWVFPEGDGWLACFAHYRSNSDPSLSRVVRFDGDWNTLSSWSFPAALIDRFAGSSSSGGTMGPSGKLFVTGHDARELYVLSLPKSSEPPVLRWEATLAISAAGQAIAWDPDDVGILYSISRKTREVIVSEITKTGR